jgi:manganese/zinc/iron transport system permease protein
LTLASRVQFAHPVLYRKVLGYLYGQAATMTDRHIWIYGTLSLFIAALVLFFYKEIQILTFDREYARTLGVKSRLVETSAFFLIVLAVVIGIRSVGVVLMSAMLIAPAVAARQFSNKLYKVFPLAGIFGLFSGFLGNYLSMEGSIYLADLYPDARLSLPTGPMIVLVASTICLIALFFAPERGLCLRLIRIARFRYRCLCENLLKAIWRHGPDMDMTFEAILNSQSISPFYLRWVLTQLTYNGWIIEPRSGVFRLTHDGQQWAAKIVRLHRLWEVYLADYLGVGAERVHRNAEEMEHIITPELEMELTLLLNDPKRDPHNKPIPPREEL